MNQQAQYQEGGQDENRFTIRAEDGDEYADEEDSEEEEGSSEDEDGGEEGVDEGDEDREGVYEEEVKQPSPPPPKQPARQPKQKPRKTSTVKQGKGKSQAYYYEDDESEDDYDEEEDDGYMEESSEYSDEDIDYEDRIPLRKQNKLKRDADRRIRHIFDGLMKYRYMAPSERMLELRKKQRGAADIRLFSAIAQEMVRRNKYNKLNPSDVRYLMRAKDVRNKRLTLNARPEMIPAFLKFLEGN